MSEASSFCRPSNNFIEKFHSEQTLQKYWKMLETVKSQFGKPSSSRTNKHDWMKKMKRNIEEDRSCRDNQVYNYLLSSTGGLKEWKPMEYKENVYLQVIYLYNIGVMNHGWDSLEDRISHFNRVWVMGEPKTKDLTTYNKRAMKYMTTLTVNNYMIHLIIYLSVQSQTT